jgi:hypothetical protein
MRLGSSSGSGFLRFMPLPELIQNNDRFYAGFLSEIGTVRSSDLHLANRIASLSELGVLLLQQRFIANLARVAVTLARWTPPRQRCSSKLS